MRWEFETVEGHTIRVTVSPDGVALSTRQVSGPVEGEIVDLETFEGDVLPQLESLAGDDRVEGLREALAAARAQRDRDDDDVP